jgi:hypothetical protein
MTFQSKRQGSQGPEGARLTHSHSAVPPTPDLSVKTSPVRDHFWLNSKHER